ncbi:hypothetical protein [Shewanella glacialipiscicola]|jgi:hypothetical protein|uniref:hypothetical protein n=1 Tax=Shewanella glacialipiscicola TaxID=614069 RepID=UPI003D797CAE
MKTKLLNISEFIAERNAVCSGQKKTLTKEELIQLLDKYPDDTEIVLTVTQADIESNPHVDLGGILVRELRISGDHSYDAQENSLALCVW